MTNIFQAIGIDKAEFTLTKFESFLGVSVVATILGAVWFIRRDIAAQTVDYSLIHFAKSHFRLVAEKLSLSSVGL